MKTAQPIAELCERFRHATYQFEKDAFQEALQRKEEIALYMRQVLNEMLHPSLYFWRDRELTAHYYALFLLTELRETKAHRSILSLLGAPYMIADYMWAGLRPEDFERALAATCGGDHSGIAMLIRGGDVHIDVRRAAVDSLVRLVACERIRRSDAIICLTHQFSRIERNPSDLLEQMVNAAEMLSASELKVQIRSACRMSLIQRKWTSIETNLTGDHSHLIGDLQAFYNSEKPADHENRDWWNPLRRPRSLS